MFISRRSRGIARPHGVVPPGASGARLPVTLLHEMARRDATRGLATLCVGFGQGAAITFERR